MVKIIFIRGAPAVGKTTITKRILEKLKLENKLDCAYICEDDFRKKMQFKYKSNDLIVHKNSAKLIEIVILKLLEFNDYNYIFIEGQFRYKEVLKMYEKFLSENKFNSIFFQLDLDINEMKRRDKNLRNLKSRDIEDVKRDIDSYIPKNIKMINSNNSIENVTLTMMNQLFN